MNLIHIFKKFKRKSVLKNYVFYKIIDDKEINNEKVYILRCLHTSRIFYHNFSKIYFDKNILYHLHPIQACFISFEYHLHKSLNKDTIMLQHRYGIFVVKELIRGGLIKFYNILNGKEEMKQAIEIVYNDELIENFDSTHAAYIGKVAGLNLRRKKNKLPNLKLIIGGKENG